MTFHTFFSSKIVIQIRKLKKITWSFWKDTPESRDFKTIGPVTETREEFILVQHLM